MENWLFVFFMNILGGIAVFVLLNLLLSLTGGTVDTVVLIGLFFFIQLSFIATLLYRVLDRLNK